MKDEVISVSKAGSVSGERKEAIRRIFLDAGACAVGFARAEEVDAEVWDKFLKWLKRGDNAGMEYMRNYPDLRRDPRLLMENTRTIVVLAFSYAPKEWRSVESGMIAAYAYGKDYHKEIRKLLKNPLRQLDAAYPGMHSRICIDSAPILEHYWASRAGVGFKGDNGTIIVPGFGSLVFLTEILMDIDIEPDEPVYGDCGHCGACRQSCPGGAIEDHGEINCRRCISYLTIEHRGEWTEKDSMEVMKSRAGTSTIFGCDICLRVCPHNRTVPATHIEAFSADEHVKALSREVIASMVSDEELNSFLISSPIKRATLRGLKRNIASRQG